MIKFTYALKLVNFFVNWKVHLPALELCCPSSEIGETRLLFKNDPWRGKPL